MTHSARGKYIPTIGLEVHAQLLTKSKIFAPDATQFGESPNTHVGVITLAHPGSLPKLNQGVVALAMRMGLACGCEISREQIFDRKNYFYPDLPKGYQITQDRTPICVGGEVPIRTEAGERTVALNRIHLEEDAGKSIHREGEPDTLVDFNRAGVPLIEIVTEPVIDTAEEAAAFLNAVRQLVRYLEVCDGNMEEGSLRCDANISVRPVGQEELGPKVEVKNMNSARNVARAVEYEIERQIALLEAGETIISETRTYDAARNTTSGMRTKEALNDYRYFPDPDLSPLHISDAWLDEVRAEMPALPWELEKTLVETYGLPAYDAAQLTENKATAAYFQEACAHTQHYKLVSNWLMGPVKSYLNEAGTEIEDFPLPAEQLAALVELVEQDTVSFSAASQQLFPELVKQPTVAPAELAETLGLIQNSNEDELGQVIDEVLTAFPDKIKEYRQGKKGLMGMFVGQVMKKTQGKADPKLTNRLLAEKLKA